jgi:molecular chaperone GrpE
MDEAQGEDNGSGTGENETKGSTGDLSQGDKVEQEQEVGESSQDIHESADGAPLVAEIAAVKADLIESRDRYVRLMADFENYKKRSLKEQSELLKYQGERLVVDMLEVVDNLELALSHSSADFDKLKVGLEMVHKLFIERLAKWDIRGESGIGANFDPQKHSAISRVPGADAAPGTIMGELKKAYFYKDKLIRHGEVVVATEGE